MSAGSRAAGGGELGELLDAFLDDVAHAALGLAHIAPGRIGAGSDIERYLDRVGERARVGASLLHRRGGPGAGASLVDVGLAGVQGAFDLGRRHRRTLRAGWWRLRLLLARGAQ